MITLNDDNSKKVFEAAFFPSNEASLSLTLNNTGDYSYFEKGVNKAVPSFVISIRRNWRQLRKTGICMPMSELKCVICQEEVTDATYKKHLKDHGIDALIEYVYQEATDMD